MLHGEFPGKLNSTSWSMMIVDLVNSPITLRQYLNLKPFVISIPIILDLSKMGLGMAVGLISKPGEVSKCTMENFD